MSAYVFFLAVAVVGTQATPDALVLTAKGKSYLQQQGSTNRSAVSKGSFLRPGCTLFVGEDAGVLLLYREGRYSRVRGPARVTIHSKSNGKGSAFQRRLASTFRQLQAVQRRSTTVGGVRTKKLVQILSPIPRGVTPTKFRLVLHRHVSQSQRLSAAALADEIRISGKNKKRTFFELTIDPLQTQRLSRVIDLKRGDRRRAKAIGSELVLDIRFLEIADGDRSVLASRRQAFTLASAAQHKRLTQKLRAIQRQDKLPPMVRSLARIEAFRSERFLGEATAEVAELLRKDPGNSIWTRTLQSLNAEK